ncbi:MAG: AN1-type zinc finger domain-containing protein [Candidatus Bathyarchaeia archaeon]
MPQCSHCGQTKETLTFTCNYCRRCFCSKHKLPEFHHCTNLSQAQSLSVPANVAELTAEIDEFEKSRKRAPAHGFFRSLRRRLSKE